MIRKQLTTKSNRIHVLGEGSVHAMSLKHQGQHHGVIPRPRLRWGLFAGTLTPCLLVTGVLLLAIGQGAIATSFAVSGRDMKVSAIRIEGTGYATYPRVVTSADGRRHPVLVIAIRSGRVRGLCQSSVISTPLGRYVLRLTTPTRAASVRVTNLTVSATSIRADLDFSSLQINRDAATLDAVPGQHGDPGEYGLQAVGFAVNSVKAQSWVVETTTIQAQGTRLALGRNEPECF
jgi:hypothetical protein